MFQDQQVKTIFTEMGASETHDVDEGCVTLSVVAVTGSVTITNTETNTEHTFTAGDNVIGEQLPVLSGNNRYKAFEITTASASSAKVTEVR